MVKRTSKCLVVPASARNEPLRSKMKDNNDDSSPCVSSTWKMRNDDGSQHQFSMDVSRERRIKDLSDVEHHFSNLIIEAGSVEERNTKVANNMGSNKPIMMQQSSNESGPSGVKIARAFGRKKKKHGWTGIGPSITRARQSRV
ncbi:hypothetical protein Ancab_033694 [Ancistrocladus abbreviatus]